MQGFDKKENIKKTKKKQIITKQKILKNLLIMLKFLPKINVKILAKNNFYYNINKKESQVIIYCHLKSIIKN